MTAVLQETLRILCRALGQAALPAADVVRVERWTELPGYRVDGLRKIILESEQRGTRVTSARYWEPAVLEAFRPLAPPPEAPARPRLSSERPWSDYLAAYTSVYGSPDAPQREYLRDRWQWERRVLLGWPLEVDDETSPGDPAPHGREPVHPALPIDP